MNNEEFFNFLTKIESNLKLGLDESCGAIGLTREDSESISNLRDYVAFVVGSISYAKTKLMKKEEKSYETKTKKK